MYWTQSFVRTLILDDVYRPHTYAEIEALVAQQVAARLDETERYGVFWFNRTRTTRKRSAGCDHLSSRTSRRASRPSGS